MKSTGIVRNIDVLGRIVIPKETRRTLHIENLDPMEIYVQDDCIILKKYSASCLFCGSPKNLVEYQDKRVCSACIDNLDKAR